MSSQSSIEWTDATWNPITGCTEVSPGCDRCYARVFAERFRGAPGHPYEHGFDLTFHPERFQLPERWKKPRRIFANLHVLEKDCTFLFCWNFFPVRNVVQRIDLIAQAITNFINIGFCNLYTWGNTSIARKFTDQSCLFLLYSQIGINHLAQKFGSFTKNLHSIPRLQVGITTQTCLVMQLHCSSLKLFGKPLNESIMSHSYGNNGINSSISVRANSSNVDTAFPVYQTSNICSFFKSQQGYWVGRTICQSLSFDLLVTSTVIRFLFCFCHLFSLVTSELVLCWIL